MYISSNENALSFLQAAQFVLKTPHISAPYKTMGLIRWSYKWRLVLILGSPDIIDLVSLKEVLTDFLKISTCA